LKNALTFWEGGKLQRSDIFVVPQATSLISPIGAAYSELFSDDAAPERSLGSLRFDDSTNMSALTGLAPLPEICVYPCPSVVKNMSIVLRLFKEF